jgi:16S rRNA (cytidine1402-2'-O)-methyltransferase
MTFRAIRILNEADTILAEDTRVTAKLLRHYEIGTPMQAHHQFNEHKSVEHLADRIEQGETIALVTDAGTPGISDPGFLLVRECARRGILVSCLPGATAFVPALVNSALPCDKFWFEGFLPHKKGRKTRIDKLANIESTIALYESPYRLVKSLQQLAEGLGAERNACVCREISKIHEESVRGTLIELVEHFTGNPPKGEIVIVVEGISAKEKKREDKE